MPIRVLIVDDSGFFRRRVAEMLEADPRIEVIGAAANGVEAVDQAVRLKPDVITMDIEMPVMDGITAVRRVMAMAPTSILMFSSLTTDGAQATLDALDAGAVDYLPKRFEDMSSDRDEARRELCERVFSVGFRRHKLRSTTSSAPEAPGSAPLGQTKRTEKETERAVPAGSRGQHKLVVIGTSTGGPVALQHVLTKLPADFPAPILLIQHMPASFTPAFANRLNQQCEIMVKEAEDGDRLKPGLALLAPGGRQMTVKHVDGRLITRIQDSLPGQNYKPSVDITFESAAKAVPGHVLAIVLTGMGADGREGARLLKQGGATIWTQDEATSVVYGMPGSVADAGLSDEVLPLAEIGPHLVQRVR